MNCYLFTACGRQHKNRKLCNGKLNKKKKLINIETFGLHIKTYDMMGTKVKQKRRKERERKRGRDEVENGSVGDRFNTIEYV